MLIIYNIITEHNGCTWYTVVYAIRVGYCKYTVTIELTQYCHLEGGTRYARNNIAVGLL